jgi:hypothetical protein
VATKRLVRIVASVVSVGRVCCFEHGRMGVGVSLYLHTRWQDNKQCDTERMMVTKSGPSGRGGAGAQRCSRKFGDKV